MAAEAHAAGSKPDPVPLASERAPDARARARDPPFPPHPSLARPLLTPQPLPSFSSSFSPYHRHQPPSAFRRPFFFPALPLSPTVFTPIRGRSGTSGHLPSRVRTLVRSLPPSLARSLSSVPQSLPSRLLSFSLPR